MQLTLPAIKRLANSSTLLVYADQALVSGCSFLSSVVLARYLGATGFGIYSIAWLGVLVASSFNQPFIISPMQTLSQRKLPDDRPAYLQALIFKQLAFAASMAFLAAAAVLFMQYVLSGWNVGSILIAFPLAVFAFLLQDFFRRHLFVINKPRKALLIDAVAYGGVLCSAFAIHFFRSMDAQFVLLLTAVFFLYASLIGLWSVPELKFNPGDIRRVINEHWNFSKWLTATALLQWFAGNLFIITGGALLGPVAVGATRMAQNIVGVTHVLFLAMENIIPLRAAGYQKMGGNDLMIRYLWKFTLQMGFLTMTLLALIGLFHSSIISFFYGPEYLPYKGLLVAFCVLYVIVFLGYPLRYALRTLQRTRVIFTSFVVTSVVSMILAYPAISAFGVYGIVGGLMLSQLITLSFYLIALRKEINLFS